MSLAGFLCLDGDEIANVVRSLVYLRDSDVSQYFSIGVDHTCGGTATTGCEMDEYMAELMQPDCLGVDCFHADFSSEFGFCTDDGSIPIECLSCYIDALNEDFSGIAVDPAPWYVSTQPASEEFLGFLPASIELDSPVARTISRRATGGGTLSPNIFRHRVISITGQLYAETPRGMNYGERWLMDALSNRCDDADLSVLPAGLPIDATDLEDDAAFRTLKRVGVVDGPNFRNVVSRACVIREVSFQLASEQPYLFAPAEELINETLGGRGVASYVWSLPEWPGDGVIGLTLTNDSTFDVTDTIVTLRPLADGDTCTEDWDEVWASPCIKFTVDLVRAGEHIIIDPTTYEVLRYDKALKGYVNGWADLTFDGAFPWLEVGPCTDACVTVRRMSHSPSLHVLAEGVRREL